MIDRPVGMILCAGLGSRLHPLTIYRPKPILELLGKPLIFYIIKMLEAADVKDIIINLHYQASRITKALERYPFSTRLHFVHEKNILGTAGGIAHALHKLAINNRSLIVIHGDIFCGLKLTPFIASTDFCQLICEKDRTIAGYAGNIGVDEQNFIVELGQFYSSGIKPHSRGFFTGIHFLSSEAVQLLKSRAETNLVAEVYPHWLKEGLPIKGFIGEFTYNDLGTPERLFQANMDILRNLSVYNLKNLVDIKPCSFGDNIFIEDHVTIEKSAKLKGPLFIARGACIEANAELGPYVVVGERSTIGSYAQIKNSLIMSDTFIEKAELLDCRIALNRVRVLVDTENKWGEYD